MECATATTFRTCIPDNNSDGSLFVVQNCSTGTECKPRDDGFIICGQGGLVI